MSLSLPHFYFVFDQLRFHWRTLNLVVPSSSAVVEHARVFGKENIYNRGENSAVPGLLLNSILIAVSLKARRVPLTVPILISVIAFQSEKRTSGVGNSAACHPLQDRRHAPLETLECLGL